MSFGQLAALAMGFSSVLFSFQAQPANNPQTSRLRTVTPATAPERIVYEVFAAEVVANDRRSNDLTLAPGHRERIGRRLQLVTGLNDADYSTFKNIAYHLMEALRTNAKEGSLVYTDSRLAAGERD